MQEYRNNAHELLGHEPRCPRSKKRLLWSHPRGGVVVWRHEEDGSPCHCAGEAEQPPPAAAALGFSRDPDSGLVVLRVTQDTYEGLLFALGTSAGVATRDQNTLGIYRAMWLANAISAGNPNFRQYGIPDEYKREFERTV